MLNELYLNTGDRYQNLADAIINQSCEDFMKLSWKVYRLKKLRIPSQNQKTALANAKIELIRILSFYRSEWYSTLTNLAPDCLIAKLNEEVSFMPILEYRDKIRVLVNRIKRKQREIKLVRLALEAPSSPKYDNIPSVHSDTSKTEAGLIKISELEEDIENTKKEMISIHNEVCAILDNLSDKDNRDILYKYIVELKTWDTIADEMMMSIATIYRRRKESLKFLSENLKEETA